MLVVTLMVGIGTMIADAEHRVGSVRQLVLGKQVAVGRIEVDGLVRKGDEHQGEYAKDAYSQGYPILADACLQLKASPFKPNLPSLKELSLPSIKQKRRELVAPFLFSIGRENRYGGQIARFFICSAM